MPGLSQGLLPQLLAALPLLANRLLRRLPLLSSLTRCHAMVIQVLLQSRGVNDSATRILIDVVAASQDIHMI